MIEALFVIVWTLLYAAVAGISWIKIAAHWKVYLMIIYNWLYLSGVFYFYPKIHQIMAA